MDESVAPDPALFPERVGDRLRAARLVAGIDLSDVATRTRIPLRHLTAIEAGDYGALPARTYCVGFVRSFARAVGADEVSLARDVRAELGMSSTETRNEYVDYESADASRIPSRMFAWTALGLALLIGIGWSVWRSGYLNGVDTASPAVEENQIVEDGAAPSPTNTVAAPVTGTVVLTATDKVWLRVYDRNNKVLIGRELAPGESFELPANVDKPMIRTTLPQKIKISVGGKEVAPLGTEEKLIKDVEISAAALAARPAPAAPATAASPATVQGSSTQP
jgi:cytoskeleton protein RodZ